MHKRIKATLTCALFMIRKKEIRVGHLFYIHSCSFNGASNSFNNQPAWLSSSSFWDLWGPLKQKISCIPLIDFKWASIKASNLFLLRFWKEETMQERRYYLIWRWQKFIEISNNTRNLLKSSLNDIIRFNAGKLRCSLMKVLT